MNYLNTIFVLAALLVASANAEDPWTPSSLCPFPSEETTRSPYEGDCSKYWECYEGARYPMNCPDGLEFNAETLVCDSPTVANCDPDATVTYPTFSHSTVSTQSTVSTPDPGPLPECPFPSNDLTFFPVVNNCAQYWECYQGNRYLMNCPSGLYWNTKTSSCDYAANVDCSINNATTTSSARPTVTTPINSVTTAPDWTPDPDCPYPSINTTFFPHPTDCAKYYECFEGTKSLMDCPAGLVWNDVADACDYKENVDCNRTPIQNSTTSTPVQSTTPSASCIGQPNGTFLPSPADCTKFYECVGDVPVEEKCPSGLYFNTKTNLCDYPEKVNCTMGNADAS